MEKAVDVLAEDGVRKARWGLDSSGGTGGGDASGGGDIKGGRGGSQGSDQTMLSWDQSDRGGDGDAVGWQDRSTDGAGCEYPAGEEVGQMHGG